MPATAPLTRDGLVIIAPLSATCSVGQTRRTLDGALVSPVTAAEWRTMAKWTTHSDHAMLTFTRSLAAGRSKNCPCSPAAYWAVPATAREELRRDLDRVATALGVPPIQGSTAQHPPTARQGPGDTPAGDLTLDLGDPAGQEQCVTTPPQNGNGEPDIPWNPLLAALGRIYFKATVDAWWRRARAKGADDAPEKAELKKIASMPLDGPEHCPSTFLAAWLVSMQGPDRLTTASARQWLGVWVRIEQAKARAMLSVQVTGPSAERARLGRAHRAGRAMHGKKGQAQRFTLIDGTAATSTRDAGRELIGTRAHIWFTRPVAHGEQEPVVTGYCEGRTHSVPADPPLSPSALRGSVMAQGSSGVGTDNVPYEILQLHPQFTAHWIGQAFWVVKGGWYERHVAAYARPAWPCTESP